MALRSHSGNHRPEDQYAPPDRRAAHMTSPLLTNDAAASAPKKPAFCPPQIGWQEVLARGAVTAALVAGYHLIHEQLRQGMNAVADKLIGEPLEPNTTNVIGVLAMLG